MSIFVGEVPDHVAGVCGHKTIKVAWNDFPIIPCAGQEASLGNFDPINSSEMNNRAGLRQQLRETSETQISAGLSEQQRRVHPKQLRRRFKACSKIRMSG